ncbi:MAG: hypothetical protein EB120_00615, partial [Proteobacteria bacterium]|nr:hypothetical protein [Pseudomonadota bacterium]
SSCLLNRSKLTPNIFERSLDENASQSYQLLLNLSVEAKGSISKSNKSISEIYLERKDEYERTEVFMGSLLRKQQAVISRFSRKFGFQIGKLRRFLVSSNKRLDVMR